MGATAVDPGVASDEPGVRRRAYLWGGAELDEVKSWRKLAHSDGTSPIEPAAFHRAAVRVLSARGFQIEEELPSPAEPERRRSAAENAARIEGAVQGEWAFRSLPNAAPTQRRVALGFLIGAVGCFAIAGVGVAIRSEDLIAVFVLGLFLLIFAVATFPGTAFLSDMIWIVYLRDGATAPTTFTVRTAQVRSMNARSKHGRQRDLLGLNERPELVSLRERVAAELSSSDALS